MEHRIPSESPSCDGVRCFVPRLPSYDANSTFKMFKRWSTMGSVIQHRTILFLPFVRRRRPSCDVVDNFQHIASNSSVMCAIVQRNATSYDTITHQNTILRRRGTILRSRASSYVVVRRGIYFQDIKFYLTLPVLRRLFRATLY